MIRYINGKKHRLRSIWTCIIKHDFPKLKEYFTCFPDEIDKIIDEKQLRTPLLSAIENNFIEGALYLIEKGANVSLLDYFNISALIRAVKINSYELCKRLISIDKDLVSIEQKEGRTAVWYAISQIGRRSSEPIDFRILDLLVENGADMYKPISNKTTAYELITHQDNAKEILSHIKSKYPQLITQPGAAHAAQTPANP